MRLHSKKIKQLAIMVKTAAFFNSTIDPEDVHRVPLMAGVSRADRSPRAGNGQSPVKYRPSKGLRLDVKARLGY
jgi:hypothetical protein